MQDKVLRDLAARFAGKRILIVGDVMLDEYIRGGVRRISPEAPVPVVEFYQQTHVPGGAGNTAANVRSLGGESLLGGVVGRDLQGETLRETLRRGGVTVDGLIVDADRLTTTKTRIVAHNQQLVRIDRERREPLSTAREDDLLRWMEKEIARADACILSDYAKGVVSARVGELIIRLARLSGKPVIVDPKGTNYAKYRGATVVKPNLHEAERFLNREIGDDASLHEVGRHLTEILDGSAVLITARATGHVALSDRHGTGPLPVGGPGHLRRHRRRRHRHQHAGPGAGGRRHPGTGGASGQLGGRHRRRQGRHDGRDAGGTARHNRLTPPHLARSSDL